MMQTRIAASVQVVAFSAERSRNRTTEAFAAATSRVSPAVIGVGG